MTSASELGRVIRDEVLGGAGTAGIDDDEFMMPLRQIILEYCWGSVWSREGLSRQVRSLLNLAILAALNRPHELELHLKGAVNNGCSQTEIQEALLQVAVYAGIPAGLDAFLVAGRVLEDMRQAAKESPGDGKIGVKRADAP